MWTELTYEERKTSFHAYRQAVIVWFKQNGCMADETTIQAWVEYLVNGWEVPNELAILAYLEESD